MLPNSISGYVPWYFNGASKINQAAKSHQVTNTTGVPIMGTNKLINPDSSTSPSLKRIEFEKFLSNEEKATLEKMYNYSEANNISTEQVDSIAQGLAMDKWLAAKGNQNQPTLDVDYLTRLIDESRLTGAAAQRLDSTVMREFIQHFGSFKSVDIII